LSRKTSFTPGPVFIACFALALIHQASGHQALAFFIATQSTTESARPDIPALASKLEASGEEERREAALKLAAIATPEVLPALTEALDDSSERVRAIAATGLAAVGDPSSIPILIARLAEEKKSPFVRKTIVYSLGRFKNPQATTALTLALKDKEIEVRSAAAVALANYGDQAAIAPLILALEDKSEFVRAHAARALGVNGRAAASATSRLARLLSSDPDNEVRRQSAIALGLIGERSALPALKQAEMSADPHLSRAARAAIKLIDMTR
jgi:HEAT repeat protein